MLESQSVKQQTAIVCTCGHPGSEHSACSGECYLCACKHYVPGSIEPEKRGLFERVYHGLSIWIKQARR